MLGQVRLSEHELTAALTGAAKSVHASRRGKGRRAAGVEDAWAGLDRYARFQLLDALGGQVLPVLVALPDVDVAPGTRPAYDDRTVARTVEGLLDESTGRIRRAVQVRARTALVQLALSHVPPRRDPDGLTGPVEGAS